MEMQNVKEPGWQGQRKRKYQPPGHIEMTLRKSFQDDLKEYAKHCSLAGVRQMCDPNISVWQRLLWIAVFCTAMITSIYFLLYIWSNTLSSPFIVTMESSTYPISEIDFPGVAICNINRISKKALTDLAKEEYHELAKNKESLEEVERILLQWGRLLDSSFNESLRNIPVYTNLLDKYRTNTHRVMKIMKRLAPSCEEMLLKCTWAGLVVDCNTIFTVRRTVRGHCCAFNYIQDFDAIGRPSETIAKVKRQTEPGLLYGLGVVIDPMLDDYAYPLSNVQGLDILIFDSAHFPDPTAGHVIHRIAEPGRSTFFELKSTKQEASREVRKYSYETRKCLFHDEFKNVFGSMYSYSACVVVCRTRTIQLLCKCTPYYVARRSVDDPVCTLENLRCLHKYREKFLYLYPHDAEDVDGLEMETQDSIDCFECLPDCECTVHTTKFYEVPFEMPYLNEKNFVVNVFRGINMTDKVFFAVFQSTPDSIFDRLDVVYYWFEIMSNIGGFGGIIVGFSFVSLTEVIYFLTIRFIQLFYINYIKYH